MKKISALFLLFIPFIISGQVYLDPTASIDERVNDLLSRMNLQEKIGQMTQADRDDHWI